MRQCWLIHVMVIPLSHCICTSRSPPRSVVYWLDFLRRSLWRRAAVQSTATGSPKMSRLRDNAEPGVQIASVRLSISDSFHTCETIDVYSAKAFPRPKLVILDNDTRLDLSSMQFMSLLILSVPAAAQRKEMARARYDATVLSNQKPGLQNRGEVARIAGSSCFCCQSAAILPST